MLVSSVAVSAQDLEFDESNMIERDPYGRLMVGVHVNGQGPFPFILDTGASRSVIYRSLTALMNLDSIPNKSRRIITTAGYKRVLIYPVTDMYALGRTIKIEDTVALPDVVGSQAKGLLGVDALSKRTLLISENNTIALLLPDSDSLTSAAWVSVQGRPVAYGSLAVEVEIGGVTIPVVVDTGASNTVINTAGLEALRRSSLYGVEVEERHSTIAGTRSEAIVKLRKFGLGEFAVNNAEFYVADVPVFSLLGARRVPAIILGMDVLGKQSFAIDFKAWRLLLKKTAE